MVVIQHDDLGARIKQAMEELRISQGELAAAVGASPAAISQWVSGRKRPSRTNIQKVAQELKVKPEWLEYGVNQPIADDEEAQRAEHLAATTWAFRPQPKDGGRDFGNANIWSFDPTVASVARETGQNVKDAQIATRSQAVYRLIVLKGAELDSFLAALKWDLLKPHLDASSQGRQKLAHFVRDGLSHLERKKELLLLRIEDRGGVGLTGEEFPRPDESGHFTALCKNNLDSEKDSRAAGAFGLGKAVLWRASRLATVLFHSQLSAATAEGHQRNRVFGRVELTWHEVDGEPYAGPGWFGAHDAAHDCAVSVWENRTLADDLYMERQHADSGTTILVVGFQDPTGDEEQPKVLARQLEESLAKNFWPAIVSDRLSFRVEVAEGRDIKASSDVDPRVLEPHLVEALTAYRSDAVVDSLAAVGDVVARKVALGIPRRVATDDPHPALKHEAVLLVRQAAEDDDTAAQVVFFRGAEMIVVSEKWKGLRVGAKPFHAVVMCGEAAANDPAAVAAERFLRTAEPPAHNAWQATQELKVAYVPGGKARLDEFMASVRATIAEIVAPDSRDLSDGPRALKELLRIGPPSDPPAERPRVFPHSATVDERGRWVVDATVRTKADTILDGKPVIVFRAETGGGQQVRWDELRAVKGCVEKEGRLVINKGARECRFQGATDPLSHPVPAEASTVFIEFRDARMVKKVVEE